MKPDKHTDSVAPATPKFKCNCKREFYSNQEFVAHVQTSDSRSGEHFPVTAKGKQKGNK